VEHWSHSSLSHSHSLGLRETIGTVRFASSTLPAPVRVAAPRRCRPLLPPSDDPRHAHVAKHDKSSQLDSKQHQSDPEAA
jgi:hypothetical protein